LKRKIYLNRKLISGIWGGGNRWLKAFITTAINYNYEIVNKIEDADFAFIIGVDGFSTSEPDALTVARQAQKLNIPCLFRVNDCDLRKLTYHIDNLILETMKLVTHTVFVSKWLQDYFNQKQYKTSIIINGVDKDIFFEKQNQATFNAPVKFVTHHWSDNKLKGAALYEFLDCLTQDNQIEFTYIGRHKCKFKHNTKVIEPLDGLELANELRKHDVYISGSQFDPGPNHIIEAVSVGLPIIVDKNGGGCNEFAESCIVLNDFYDLINIIKNNNYPKSTYKFSDWDNCAIQYIQLFNHILI